MATNSQDIEQRIVSIENRLAGLERIVNQLVKKLALVTRRQRTASFDADDD